MELEIVLLVLASASIHPIWNLLVKNASDPHLAYLFLTVTLSLCALAHGLVAGVNFAGVFSALPLIALSVGGQILYGNCLTATLRRGDLSTYYPIIRSSPAFVVVASAVVLGKTYPPVILLGIAMVVAGGFLLLYRRGTNFLNDPRTLGIALLAMAGTGIYSLADAHAMQLIAPQALFFSVEALLVPVYLTLWLRRRATKPISAVRIRDLSLTYLLLPGIIAYVSYYMILLAYQFGGDVASVTSVRQASIPISVVLGGLILREQAMARRLFAAGFLALGIVVIALNG